MSCLENVRSAIIDISIWNKSVNIHLFESNACRKKENNMNVTTQEILNNTVSSSLYPGYMKSNFLKLAVNNNLLINNRANDHGAISLFSSMMPDVSSLASIDDKFIAALQDVNIQKLFEKFLFEKQYRLFSIFSIGNVTRESFKKLLDQAKIIPFNTFEGYPDCLDYDTPYIMEQDENILLKFWEELTDEYQNKILYPVVALFDLNNKVVEIRFDRIGINYKHTYDFYKNIISKIREWISSNLDGTTSSIDFKAVIEYAKTDGGGIDIYAQKMTRNKTSAYLENLDEGEVVMPILGELSRLIESQEDLFTVNEQTQAIKKLLVDFISKIEADSDIPQLKLRFDEKNIKIGITHEYKHTDFSLFKYYDDLTKGKEAMDYVRNFFTETYQNLNRATSPVTISM